MYRFDKKYFDESFDKYSYKFGNRWGINWRASQKFRLYLSLKLIKNFILDKKINNVLEIGCASGDFTNKLLNIEPSLILLGIDISTTAINICKNRFFQFKNCKFKTMDLLKLNYNDNLFDLVTCLEVLHYFNHSKKKKALIKINQLLKKNGYLLLSIPFNSRETNDILNLLSTNFKIIKVIYNYSKLYFVLESILLKVCYKYYIYSNNKKEGRGGGDFIFNRKKYI